MPSRKRTPYKAHPKRPMQGQFYYCRYCKKSFTNPATGIKHEMKCEAKK